MRSFFGRMDETALQRSLAALVALAAIAVYLNSLRNGFAYDDVYIIQRNTRVHDLAAWREIWLKPYWPFHGTELGIYRPFAMFMYAVQWAAGGGSPLSFHVVSIALHAAASVLVFVLLAKLVARVPAFIGALVFAVHPIHTEAVANIVGQAELVAAICLLSASLVHVTRPAGVAVSWPRRLALVPLFAIAISAKENSVVLPALLVALDFAQRRVPLNLRGLRQYADAMLLPVFLLGATLAVYLLFRFEVMAGTIVAVDANPSMPFLREPHRVLNALRAFPEFARLLFFPLDLAADYAPGVILAVDSWTAMTLLGGLLLIGLTALALLTPWWPAIGLPAAWFLVSMIIVSNLFFPIGILIAERTLYLPSVAVSLLVAQAWRAFLPKASVPVRRFAPAVAVVVLALLGVRTWLRNPSWADTPAVFEKLSQDYPQSYRAQWAQASILWQQGDRNGAAFRFAFAERMYPRDSQFMVEYGSLLLELGRRDEARALFERSYKMHPHIPRTTFMLAYTYALEGHNAEALRLVGEGEDLGLPRMMSMPLRAQVYHALGQHDRAVAAWRVAVSHAPGTVVMWAYLARTLAIAGYAADALSAADHAADIATDPADRRKIAALKSIIGSGCYAGLGRRAPRVDGAFDMPPCDTLGDYFKIAIQRAEIASALQNASIPAPERRSGRPEKNTQPVDVQ